ncbi:I78 family peptidase inhibitor [Sphingosinicella sp. CPCC 101087]|uniref:I78 family peptidase inhibitor n=1 Tax=Sphingosinicella sp. CPCC 101087 TaxID=2497754 RepID=UPI00101C22AC|nr:I78 family peptidase inhibitor [Sphingosinicella sp. CPCC 101087]
MKWFAAALLPITVACTTVPPGGTPGEPPAGGGDSGFTCSAEGLQDLAGQPATSELGAEALRRSGARTLRWIRPGDAVTMDFRQDRLNVRLDSQNRVEAFDCG